jgi:nickel-dependent lactate racemase
LDQNLYQTVKGMSAASRVVRAGGAILMVAACEDGLPQHGLYAQLLRQTGSPENVLQMVSEPGFVAQDQWQVQIQAQIQQKAQVYVYSDGLSDQQIQAALFEPCRDIRRLVSRLIATKGPRGCVIPDGPQVVPYLTGAAH